MGIDTNIAAVKRTFIQEHVVENLQVYSDVVEYISGNHSDVWVRPFEWRLRSLEGIHTLISELEPPPGVNSIDLNEFYQNIKYYPYRSQRDYAEIFLPRNHQMMRNRIPEFLESRSPEAAGLWDKLVGNWNSNRGRRPNDSLEILEAPYEFYINGDTYLVEPERGHLGFLQGDEIECLATELRPFLPELNEFYDSLEGKYSNHAGQAPVETVYTLANWLGSSAGSTMMVQME